MRFFNVTGSCDPARHYMIPAERRLPECEALIAKGAYFVVHAPRQTGKTTTMKALARRLTAEGRYAALRFSCQNAQVFPDDVGAAEDAVWSAIEASAASALPADLRPPAPVSVKPGGLLQAQLGHWAAVCPRPLVLIFDEIDAIAGPSLRSILSQLRTGFDDRPGAFPWSVILCGMRDPTRFCTSSPFNIKEESLRVASFIEAEMRELYAQHTAETGQVFTEKALARAWALTQGQPWLCNALAREVVEKIAVPLAEPITATHIDDAKERLILARATHLDSLLARLREKPVRRILGIGTVDYREVAPQLVLMAYLHRLVNGGGFIGREVGVGRKRIDLLVRWPYENRRGKRAVQREALELKVWRDRDKKGDPLAAGLVQLDAYLATLGLSRGVLVIFDARSGAAPVEDRTHFEEAVTASGRVVTLLRA